MRDRAPLAHRLRRPFDRDGPFGSSRQSRPSRAASATAAARVVRPSLWRMFATWRCTVCWLKTNCSAISWSLKPLATKANTSRSRRESNAAGGSTTTRAGAAGASAERNARATDAQSPAHGKCAFPSSGISVARRYPGRELTTQLIGDRAIVAAMYDQRGRTHLIQLRSNVVAVRQLQQHRRGLRARRLALVARHVASVRHCRVAQEDVGQQPRPQSPMGTHGSRRSIHAPPAT